MNTAHLMNLVLHRRRSLLAATGLLGLLSACTPNAKPRGQLMIVVATDMSIPKNMDQVVVEVLDDSGHKQTFNYPVRPSSLGKPMPGTLAIVPPNSGGQTVRVRLIAEQDMSPAPPTVRVVREAVVKVPTDRTAMLPMPLHWLCDGHFMESTDGSYQSDCGTDQTCVAGACVDAIIAPEQLRTYSAALVFGGGDEQGTGGRCIDVPMCFGSSELATLDTDCTFALPNGVDPQAFNVALQLTAGSDGQCTTGSNAHCFLTLDQDLAEGWQLNPSGRVQLPSAVCDTIAAGKALGVATTTACPTKDSSVPICGPWTNVATASTVPRGDTSGAGGSSSTGNGGSGAAAPASAGSPAGPSGSAGQVGNNPDPKAGQPCVTTADCTGSRSVCQYGYCGTQCFSDAECTAPTVCLRGAAAFGACLRFPCGNCPTDTACNPPEGICRASCATNTDCTAAEACTADNVCWAGKGGFNGSGGASSAEGGAGPADAGTAAGGSGGQSPAPDGGAAKSCDQFCAQENTVCGFNASNAPYPSLGACLTSCPTFPPGISGDTAGNSLACRQTYLDIAMSDATSAALHCPYTGMVSQSSYADTGANGPCN